VNECQVETKQSGDKEHVQTCDCKDDDNTDDKVLMIVHADGQLLNPAAVTAVI